MSEPSNRPIQKRASRRDKGQPRWTERDLAVLTWIAEQYGVRRDHLAVLLGRGAAAQTKAPGRLAETTVKDWVQRWRGAGVIGSTQVLAWHHSWIWLTRLGLEHLELDYRLWEPRARAAASLRDQSGAAAGRGPLSAGGMALGAGVAGRAAVCGGTDPGRTSAGCRSAAWWKPDSD